MRLNLLIQSGLHTREEENFGVHVYENKVNSVEYGALENEKQLRTLQLSQWSSLLPLSLSLSAPIVHLTSY
jgi:hypothetical protein